jgi:hypothetical protein
MILLVTGCRAIARLMAPEPRSKPPPPGTRRSGQMSGAGQGSSRQTDRTDQG